MFLDAGLKRKVVLATHAGQSIWHLTYLEVVVRVYWTLVQYGGEGGEERGSGVEGEILVTRHSSLLRWILCSDHDCHDRGSLGILVVSNHSYPVVLCVRDLIFPVGEASRGLPTFGCHNFLVKRKYFHRRDFSLISSLSIQKSRDPVKDFIRVPSHLFRYRNVDSGNDRVPPLASRDKQQNTRQTEY